MSTLTLVSRCCHPAPVLPDICRFPWNLGPKTAPNLTSDNVSANVNDKAVMTETVEKYNKAVCKDAAFKSVACARGGNTLMLGVINLLTFRGGTGTRAASHGVRQTIVYGKPMVCGKPWSSGSNACSPEWPQVVERLLRFLCTFIIIIYFFWGCRTSELNRNTKKSYWTHLYRSCRTNINSIEIFSPGLSCLGLAELKSIRKFNAIENEVYRNFPGVSSGVFR